MAQQCEHGMLSTHSRELRFHTAGGTTVVADGLTPQHVVGALDQLSMNGWQVVTPLDASNTPGFATSGYLLRREVAG